MCLEIKTMPRTEAHQSRSRQSIRHHSTPTIMANVKKTDNTGCCKGEEQLECSEVADRSVSW